MPRQFALFICVLFILWLFARDQKLRPMPSWGLWIALIWIMIIGSRPVSFWLGGGFPVVTPGDYIEGSPLDRNFFILLIILGLFALLRRSLDWSKVLVSNRWFFAFFIYCGISVMWSDYPFVGFKRWIKDFGNVVVALLILTEKDPVQATKAVFARYTYFAILLSVVLIKYYPELGRYYNNWTWQPGFRGVATTKNELGCIVFICFLLLIWDLIEMRTVRDKKADKVDLLSRIVLLLMMFWLIGIAGSATALLSLILGTGVLLFMRFPNSRRYVRHLGTYSLVMILLFYLVPNILKEFVGILGRDMTLTGRTNIWADLLSVPINTMFGTGYQSFWLSPVVEDLWKKYDWHLNQAHNGYLETYLNEGLVGLFLLMAMIISTGRKLKKELLAGNSYGILRFTFFAVAVLYNWTEALFNKLSLVWIILIIAALKYPSSRISMPETIARSANGEKLELHPSGNPRNPQEVTH